MFRLTASFVIWFALSIHPLMAQKVQHPLDPLTFQEYWTVLDIPRDRSLPGQRGNQGCEQPRFTAVIMQPEGVKK